jgi:hypothetical protein
MPRKKTILKGRLPLPAGADAGTTVTVCHEQTTHIQQNPDYGTQPEVQTATKSVVTTYTALGTVLTDLATKRAEIASLETQRDALHATLRQQHGHLESTLNIASGGDLKRITAWGMVAPTRSATPKTSAAPPGLRVTINGKPGSVVVRCQADSLARTYRFQHGSDPNNPDAWAPPMETGAAKCEFEGLPIGKTEYFRVSAFRAATGASEWSEIVGILVR